MSDENAMIQIHGGARPSAVIALLVFLAGGGYVVHKDGKDIDSMQRDLDRATSRANYQQDKADKCFETRLNHLEK